LENVHIVMQILQYLHLNLSPIMKRSYC
jgi:hypothetical protein